MPFNAPEFVFGFAPLVLLVFFLAARIGPRLALAWLTIASLFFYAWWDVRWLPLMLASIVLNNYAGRVLRARPSRVLLAAAIGINLALLAYYKYSSFVAENLIAWFGAAPFGGAGELPLGISFFTFTQIAFLVDVTQRRTADADLLRYGLFVTYYPHLVAGPILHHAEMMPQFARADVFRFDAARLAEGATIFMLGLAKKVVLADRFGAFAGVGFGAATTQPIGFFESWGAALCYTLQLYFDFSGYSDMAIGLALMIGVRLPANFDSPYQASDIADFWRRWHMTLSRFLREYLYIPLGGNRHGPLRRHANLMVTMLLGGLWHGAGWTFVAWGALHGAYLVVHQLWRSALRRASVPPVPPALRWPARALAWGLTFVAVVVGWVFFRAADLPTAITLLEGMAGRHGSVLPQLIIDALPWLAHVAAGSGKVAALADGTVMGAVEMAVLVGFGMGVVLLAPNLARMSQRTRVLLVVPSGALALQQVLFGTRSEFLYFQF